jgi:hypothetical protein
MCVHASTIFSQNEKFVKRPLMFFSQNRKSIAGEGGFFERFTLDTVSRVLTNIRLHALNSKALKLN